MLDAQTDALPAPLARFFAPTLADLRPEMRQDWAVAFPDNSLRQGILSNERLKDRVLAATLRGIPDVKPEAFVGTADEAVVTLLLTGHQAALAQALGVARHRATVLEWVTWNQLGERLPNVSSTLVRAALSAIDDDPIAAHTILAPADPALTADQIETDGQALLSIWAGGVSPALFARLCCFVELTKSASRPHLSMFVQKVATAHSATLKG